MNTKEKFLFQLSKSKKYDFDTTTMLESRLSKLIDLAEEADDLLENIEEATNAWENKIYEAKEYYNGEIRDEIESVKKTMDELGVNLDGTTFESVARQSEELNEKLSNVLGRDLFAVTREIKNSFS